MTPTRLPRMYRPPSKAPHGKWALFLHEQRKARGWSQQRGFEELRGILGLGEKSRASYILLDMGERQPTEAQGRALVEFFGAEPSEAAPEPEANESLGLIAALRAQTEALTALVAELQLKRAEDALMREELMRALGAALAQSGTRGGDGHDTREGARR